MNLFISKLLISLFVFLFYLLGCGHCQEKLGYLPTTKLPLPQPSPIRVLPERIIRKLSKWYNEGRTREVIKVIKAISNLQRLYLRQRCYSMFSSDLCQNASAQPFFIWAKMYANKLVQLNKKMVRTNINEIIRRG